MNIEEIGLVAGLTVAVLIPLRNLLGWISGKTKNKTDDKIVAVFGKFVGLLEKLVGKK